MNRPTVELVMIVRNGGSGLARCLKSALPAVDSILIGDTGSTDDSHQIAHDFGARTLDIPWENDFAKARNTVLTASHADWVLSMDSDEMLDPEGAALIPALVAQEPVDAWEVWRWNYVRSLDSRCGELVAEPNPIRLEESRPYPAFTRYLNTLLFRRRPGVYFENRVHETVSKRIRALGLQPAEAPFVIHHFGFVEDTAEVRKSKCELYQQLGRQKVCDDPEDDWALYEVGLGELEHHHDAAAGLVCFEQVIALNPSRVGAWIYAGICSTRLGRLQEALNRLRHAEQLGARSGLLAGAIGDVFFLAGDYSQAMSNFEQVSRFGPMSAVVECKLGACLASLGNPSAGLERINAAVTREPEAGALYEIWAAVRLMAGDPVGAAQVARQRLLLGGAPANSFLVADRKSVV